MDMLLRGHQFVDYPNDPKPNDLYECSGCGYVMPALLIQHARYNFNCPGCNKTTLLDYRPQPRGSRHPS
jgi:predicted RNA-binding Zn-ribbon protein involved in translation (DUF1610 family)